MDHKRVKISGRGIVLRGNDIDTDRIIPARFLRTVTFDGLGEHAFEDDRAASDTVHPFDDPDFAEATVMLVGGNFGCGSSREHAPQALARWGPGIRTIVGESFAEIFFGNCVSLGIPCLQVTHADQRALMDHVEAHPDAEIEVDVEAGEVRVGPLKVAATLPAGPRSQFLEGRWDSTAELLSGLDDVRERAEQIPYLRGYA